MSYLISTSLSHDALKEEETGRVVVAGMGVCVV